jgi:hypothetical protein
MLIVSTLENPTDPWFWHTAYGFSSGALNNVNVLIPWQNEDICALEAESGATPFFIDGVIVQEGFNKTYYVLVDGI